MQEQKISYPIDSGSKEEMYGLYIISGLASCNIQSKEWKVEFMSDLKSMYGISAQKASSVAEGVKRISEKYGFPEYEGKENDPATPMLRENARYIDSRLGGV